MSRLLYDIFLILYSLTARIIAPFNPKARKWVEGRQRVWQELQELQEAQKKRAWVHCSSLGEYEQGFPLIERLHTDYEIIVTFFSSSGYDVAKRKNPNGLIFYLPHDSRAHAREFLDIIKPSLAVFVRYDFWYYYLTELKQRNIRTILISAVFNKEDIFFHWYGDFFRKMLMCFTHIFVQDEDSMKLLAANGFSSATKAGDTRIDRVAAIQKTAKEFPLVEKFKGAKKIFIIGSLEPKDEAVVLPLVSDSSFRKHFKFIIAPHNVSKEYLNRLAQRITGRAFLYSEANAHPMAEDEVMIIDSIGMLSGLYRYADIAYVGGGFGEGLHNILEPAAWGVPVIIGIRYGKFIESKEMIDRGAVYAVSNAESLIQCATKLHSDLNLWKETGDQAHRYIRERSGGTEIILNRVTTEQVEK